MEENKKSNKKNYFLFVIIYLLIGVLVYFGIKKYYNPSDDTDNEYDKYITDSVEIEDETGLSYSLKYNKNSYALIYGTFIAIDSVHDIFLGNNYSYIKELTIDESNESDVITNERVKSSTSYNIYGVKLNGLNFDVLEPSLHKSVRDIRHKNIRYDYYVKPVEYTGTMLCKINDDDSIKCIEFYKFKTIESIRQSRINKNYVLENSFVVLWLVILFMILIGIDSDDSKFEDINITYM